MNESYEWVETAVVFRPELRNWQSSVRDGLLEARLAPYNGFSLVGTKIGGSTFDGSGRRHSAIMQILLKLLCMQVWKEYYWHILRSLRGLGYPQSGWFTREGHAMVRENGEVLLSAGAIGSPQLLLLSGIGPSPYLSSWEIPVAYPLPYVGQYLYDNPRNGISIVPPMRLEHSLIQVVGITEVGAKLLPMLFLSHLLLVLFSLGHHLHLFILQLPLLWSHNHISFFEWLGGRFV